MKLHENIIDSLVAEGKRVGKAPWCCCFYHEQEAWRILDNSSLLRYDIEDQEETIARREKEYRDWDCASWDDWRNISSGATDQPHTP